MGRKRGRPSKVKAEHTSSTSDKVESLMVTPNDKSLPQKTSKLPRNKEKNAAWVDKANEKSVLETSQESMDVERIESETRDETNRQELVQNKPEDGDESDFICLSQVSLSQAVKYVPKFGKKRKMPMTTTQEPSKRAMSVHQDGTSTNELSEVVKTDEDEINNSGEGEIKDSEGKIPSKSNMETEEGEKLTEVESVKTKAVCSDGKELTNFDETAKISYDDNNSTEGNPSKDEKRFENSSPRQNSCPVSSQKCVLSLDMDGQSSEKCHSLSDIHDVLGNEDQTEKVTSQNEDITKDQNSSETRHERNELREMVSTTIKAVADINEKEVVDEKSSDSIQVTAETLIVSATAETDQQNDKGDEEGKKSCGESETKRAVDKIEFLETPSHTESPKNACCGESTSPVKNCCTEDVGCPVEQRPQVLKDCFPETDFLNHYPTNGRISKNGKSDIKVRVPAEETPKMTSSPADTILKDIGRDGQLHKDMESSSFEKEPHVKTEATLVLDKVVESKADSVADVVVDDFMDFTDSQLCSINEDWHVPSTSEIRTPAANHEIYNQSKTLAPSSTEQPFYVTMPSTHPSRNVSDEQATQKLTGLIEELAAINSMVLNAKREMDAFKKQQQKLTQPRRQANPPALTGKGFQRSLGTRGSLP